MTVHWTVVSEAVVIIWAVCWLVIILNHDFCMLPSTTPCVCMPISTRLVDMMFTLGVPVHPFVTPLWSAGNVTFWGRRFLRLCCVWAGRLRCLTTGFACDSSFPNHLSYLPYLIQWDVFLPHPNCTVSVYIWVKVIHKQRLEGRALLRLVHSCLESKHASNACNNLWDVHDGNV